LHVGEYFIRKARNVNKNLIVFGEVFTGSTVVDAIFVKRMGLNALLRETIKKNKAVELHGHVNWLSESMEQEIGSIRPASEVNQKTGEVLELLWAKLPTSLVFDQTHDNQAIIQAHGVRQSLPIIAINSFSNLFQGTIKGVDEFFPEALSVVSERRLYSPLHNPPPREYSKPIFKVGLVYY